MAAVRPYRSPPERLGAAAIRVLAGLGFVFMLAPILAVVPLSFNGGTYLSYPLQGFSWQWYEAVFAPRPWMPALWNSVIVGAGTTVLATTIGTLAAYGLAYADFPGKRWVGALLVSPMVVPIVITALAVYLAFAPFGLVHSFLGLIVAHTVLAIPFVVITVTATLHGFDRNMVRAAASLGAGPLTGFFTVTLPLTAPGILSGAVFAFVTSFDDVVVALFLAGPEQFTVPRRMFNALRDKLDPSIVALAVFLVGISVVLLVTMELLRWRSERLRNRRPT
ncbi:MAG: ABC transporter permease [Alphaproteobacteria bacterium]|nr:ABC transporter permease [Alphaproteobacteria bacterium]MCB9931073.1 ABC transporter permease [Alphaproteobacteria bacterium]